MFRLYETRGVPLDTIIEEFDRQGYIIDWIDFYESSTKSGWNGKTTLKKIEYSLMDVKEKEYCDNVLQRLKLYITRE